MPGYYLDVDADDFIWSEPCDFCEGSGHEIVIVPATSTDPADYDYGPGRCDVCEGTVVPLCDLAHAEIHAKGWKTFETKYGVDLSTLANRLWRSSKHRITWERRNAS